MSFGLGSDGDLASIELRPIMTYVDLRVAKGRQHRQIASVFD
jgi:hypothetical protein